MVAASYRAIADELEQRTKDCQPQDRKRWLDAAASWRLMADTLDKMAALAGPLVTGATIMPASAPANAAERLSLAARASRLVLEVDC